MGKSPIFAVFVFLIFSVPSFASPLTAHRLLNGYGFPTGLLPVNVQSYFLNRTSGEFSIDLNYDCRFTLPQDNYLAMYSKKITGKVYENRIAELRGVRVRAFFKWWGITGIKANGENLVFEVGKVSAKFPSNKFVKSRECGGKAPKKSMKHSPW